MEAHADTPEDTRELKEIAIAVTGEEVLAALRSGDQLEDQKTSHLDLDARRKASIDLLAKLLRQAMDQDEIDRLADDLYKELLEGLGRELFGLLLNNEVAALVTNQLEAVRDGRVRLRMSLSFFGPLEAWLSSLPWEYIHTPHGNSSLGGQGGFLSNQTELILSRRLAVKYRSFGEDQTPITVLLVCASPTGPDRRGDTLERVLPGGMRTALEELQRDNFIRLVELIDEDPPPPGEAREGYVWQATASNLSSLAERENPVLVHFIGHGRHLSGHGELAFSNPNGSPDWVSGQWFAERMYGVQSIKTVVLQACESAASDPYVAFSGVAATLADFGIPAVIGMQYRVALDTAEKFSRAMYQALANDLPIDIAVKSGRSALSRLPNEWSRRCFGLPVLYLSQYKALTRRTTTLRGQQQLTTKANGDPKAPAGRCPNCREEFASGDLYCGECSEPLPPYCRNCTHIFTGSRRSFCPMCRAPTAPSYEDTVQIDEEPVSDEPDDMLTAYQGPGSGR